MDKKSKQKETLPPESYYYTVRTKTMMNYYKKRDGFFKFYFNILRHPGHYMEEIFDFSKEIAKKEEQEKGSFVKWLEQNGIEYEIHNIAQCKCKNCC